MTTLKDWIDILRESNIYRPRERENYMSILWDRGAIRFGKIGIRRASFDQSGSIVEEEIETTEYRSLVDPEPPPVGSIFELAWYDGVDWGHVFDVEGEIEHQKAGQDSIISMIENADRLEGDRIVAEALHTYDDYKKFFDKMRISGFDFDVVKSIFRMGVNYGEIVTLKKFGPAVKAVANSGINDEWEKVIVDARDRHGSLLTATQLLKAMGGEADLKLSHWNFPGGIEVDQKFFSMRVKAVDRRERKQGKSAEQ